MPRPESILSALRLLSDPKALKKGKFWISSIAKKLTPDDLRRAIEERRDLVPLVFNEMHLADPKVAPEAKFAGRCIWDELEPWLISVPKVYGGLIAESDYPDEFAQLLDTPEGREYLNFMVERMYNALYEFFFG